MRAGRDLLIGWLLAALVLLALDGRLAVFLARAVPGSLLGLGVAALVRQQRAPSILDQPRRSYRYQVADDLHQPLAAVVAAAEHDASAAPFQQPPQSPVRGSHR